MYSRSFDYRPLPLPYRDHSVTVPWLFYGRLFYTVYLRQINVPDRPPSAQALSNPFYLDGVLINKTPETRLNENGDFLNSELKNKFHLKVFFLENFIKTII